jgi:predicted acylesterase/phospholipase RssA
MAAQPPVIGSAGPDERPRRALVLAGGGLRLSWQAGVLHALLEAGLRFSLVDATSAGGLNAAMWLSGQSPEEMSRRWRSQSPAQAFRPRALWHYLRPMRLTAMGDPASFRERVIGVLGIDLARVRGVQQPEAWFNVLNYTRMDVECIPHTDIDEDMLVAGLSLPGMLPPVERGDQIYLDAGFVRDANPLEAVRRGADEIWIAWAMVPSPRFRGGPLQMYVQSLEMSANAALNEDLRQIEEMNERIVRGEQPHGRTAPVAVHVVRPPGRLPLDVDLYTRGASHAALIDQGYRDAWRYLDDAESGTGEVSAPTSAGESAGARFRLTLSGPFSLEARTPEEGARLGREAGETLSLEAAVAQEGDSADIVGHIDFSPLGVAIPLRRGRLATAQGRRIEYDLVFAAADKRYRLHARSMGRGGRLAATLRAEASDGEVVVGAGVLAATPAGLVRAAATLRASGTASTRESLGAVRGGVPLLLRHLRGR